ncbi:hypothetical protein ABZ557_14030 [Streptomyces sp. NPDC019645]|uniref:hypothetical protein n=1 Tax=Streptomyces sp. NPDC019645 TaxID=3154786 RepID=UPI0033FBAB48
MGHGPAPAGTGEGGAAPVPQTDAGLPLRGAHRRPDTRPDEESHARPGEQPGAGSAEQPHERSAEPVRERSREDATPPARPVAGARPALPERVPQTHMAEQLQGPRRATEVAAVREDDTPEEVADAWADYEQGTQMVEEELRQDRR